MERKGEATESFKELMLKGSFDKITIRMITEQAGVIRPTFYNYFQDKYEVFRPVFEMVEDGMEREAIYLLFRKMEKDQQYYQKAFEVTGQNGFEEILAGKLRKLIRQMMKNHKITLQKLEGLRDINIFLEFHTLTVVNGLKYWLTSREVHMSADEALEFYRFLMSHPILDVVGQVEDYTEQEQTEG
mgnify:CR=1 FL=1